MTRAWIGHNADGCPWPLADRQTTRSLRGTTMIKRLSIGFLAGMLGLGAACGGSSVDDPNCNAEGFICHPSGLAFVEVAGPASDLCGGYVECDLAKNPPAGSTTATLTQPQGGTVCLSGTVATGGWAQIVLQFALFNEQSTKILKTFDADARGITQAAFTIDSPPSGGIGVSAAVTTSLDCPMSGFDCFTYGFQLMTAPLSNIPVTITAPGPQVAPFANFEQTRSGVSQTFDTSALQYLFFGVPSGDYDFCLQDFRFLDAAGNEVKP